MRNGSGLCGSGSGVVSGSGGESGRRYGWICLRRSWSCGGIDFGFG